MPFRRRSEGVSSGGSRSTVDREKRYGRSFGSAVSGDRSLSSPPSRVRACPAPAFERGLGRRRRTLRDVHIDVRAHRPRGLTPRRDAGLYAYERVLERAGLGPVAGVDEAGRGACAGPLVVAAVVLAPGRRAQIEGLADSKLLTAVRREQLYAELTARATAWSALIVSREEIDRIGLHRCNIAGMRRALAGLDLIPGYVLTDGFRVPGLVTPGLPVPKGDRVAACVAAASIVAKVTRDRI